MADAQGFLNVKKSEQKKRPISERIKDWNDVYLPITPILRNKEVADQARRCMDCGIPFCHSSSAGCPLGNLIPEWNDMARKEKWGNAIERLHATNNFPEFTGKICPAPCESACVLSIDPELSGGSVTIKRIEETIIENAWEADNVEPQMATKITGKSVAVVGSGPAGLAAAQQLTRAGHNVTVYEKDDRLGGLLRYGIPEYKLNKSIIERRILQMRAESTIFRVNVEIGVDITLEQLMSSHDAVVLAVGALKGRDPVDIPGRNLNGVHLAMEHLVQANKESEGDEPAVITAKDKNVLIIGGGDTGADCLGTAHRQGALSVLQLDYNIRPPEKNNHLTPWPMLPLVFKSSTSHDEGGDRHFEVAVQRFLPDELGNVKEAVLSKVNVIKSNGERKIVPVGEEFSIPCELVLFAIGFEGVEDGSLANESGLQLRNGKIECDSQWESNLPGVFTCGDCHKGASLVVWAIAEGRSAAKSVDTYLMGYSDLPDPVVPEESLLSS